MAETTVDEETAFGFAIGRQVTRIANQLTDIIRQRQDAEEMYRSNPSGPAAPGFQRKVDEFKAKEEKLKEKLALAKRGLFGSDPGDPADAMGENGKLREMAVGLGKLRKV
jgi:hypothetical protein